MICLSHYFCWPSILPTDKSIFAIFMWLLCLLLRQGVQELPRASTNSARLYKTEGWDIFSHRVCVDFQLAFTETIQRREHRKNFSVLKVHDTPLVREKICQELCKSLYPLKGQIRLDKLYLSLLCEKQFQRHFYPQTRWKNLTSQCW